MSTPTDITPPPAEVQPPPRKRSRHGIIAAVVVVVIAAAGITAGLLLSGGSTSPPIVSHGTVTLLTGIIGGPEVSSAYPDVTNGSQVTVTNSAGTVVGTGTLSYSLPQTAADAASLAAAFNGDAGGSVVTAGEMALHVAVYDFTVDVPGGQARYGVTVGTHGTEWLSASQMKSGPALQIGSLTS